MGDRAGLTEEVRAATAVRVGSVTLLPIERVVLHAERAGHVAWVTAAVEPLALVVRDAGGVRVVDVGAPAPSLEQLRERIAGLDAALESTVVADPPA
jgi:hypothetical protein